MRTTVALVATFSIGSAALLASFAAPQSGRPPAGARVAVLAYHDSRLLTLCPAFGELVVRSGVLSDRMAAKVAVTHLYADRQSMFVLLDATRKGALVLPLPASQAASAGSQQPDGPAALDRLAPDVAVEQRLSDEFRARKNYSVVASPAEADFVFIAESYYIAMSAGLGAPPPPREKPVPRGPERIFKDADNEFSRRMTGEGPPVAPPPPPPAPSLTVVAGGDRHLNWRQSTLALVVPASAYRQHPGDAAALTAASLWSGLEMDGWAASREPPVRLAASPEALVRRFHQKGNGVPDYLPVCAATAGTIRSIHDGDGSAPAATAPSPDDRAQAAGPPAIPRGGGPPRFASRTTLVTVPVTVTDRDGQPVRDLPLAAFRVFEDDVEQKVARLEQGTEPADVALLLDTSGSMRGPREALRASAPAVAGAMRAADRAVIVSIGSRVRVLTSFTRDPGVLRRALAEMPIEFGGGTRLYDGVALVAVDVLEQLQGRKAIILLSDGVDTQSQLTNAEGALAAIESSNTPVFVIRYETGDAGAYMRAGPFGIRQWLVAPDGPEAAEEAYAAADRFLVRLAARTGGRLFVARADADVPDMLVHIGEELSRQIILGYHPSDDTPDGRYRRIRVTAECDGCAVRARAGYRADVSR